MVSSSMSNLSVLFTYSTFNMQLCFLMEDIGIDSNSTPPSSENRRVRDKSDMAWDYISVRIDSAGKKTFT